MNKYTSFANVYDLFMDNVPYDNWIEYIEKIWSDNNHKPNLVLDLACGTGSISKRLVDKKYDVIGVDASEDMLIEARKKVPQVLLLNQDMENLDLYGTVDSCICLCDSLNYILKLEQLLTVFKLVNNFLNPKGIFIFDINTEYKFTNVLGNNSFSKIEEEAVCVWENNYDKDEKIMEYVTNFFIKENEYYKRFEEIHYEKSYTTKEIKEVLNRAGFRILNVYNELEFNEPTENSQRIFFVAQENIK